MHAKYLSHLSTLVLIVQAVFILMHGHTHTHKVRDATDHVTDAMASASAPTSVINNKQLIPAMLQSSRRFPTLYLVAADWSSHGNGRVTVIGLWNLRRRGSIVTIGPTLTPAPRTLVTSSLGSDCAWTIFATSLFIHVWWFGAVVELFIAETKLLYVEHRQYWDGWPSLGECITSICNHAN